MPAHLILLVIAFVLLLLAGFFEWPWTTPRTTPAPNHGWAHALGWFGLAAFVLAALVP